MPLTYSIAYGIAMGFASWCVINSASWLIDLAQGKKSIPDKKAEINEILNETYQGLPCVTPPWKMQGSEPAPKEANDDSQL